MASKNDFRTNRVSKCLAVATDGTLLTSDNEHSENSEPLVIYEDPSLEAIETERKRRREKSRKERDALRASSEGYGYEIARRRGQPSAKAREGSEVEHTARSNDRKHRRMRKFSLETAPSRREHGTDTKDKIDRDNDNSTRKERNTTSNSEQASRRRRRRKRAQYKKSLETQHDTPPSELRDSKDKQPFSRKFLKWLKSLHLYTFKEALRDQLGATRIEHLFNKEDCDFRSIGMTEEQVEVVMTEVMKLLERRAGEVTDSSNLKQSQCQSCTPEKVADSSHLAIDSPFSKKILRLLKSLHLYSFKEALRDELGVTKIEHLLDKEDCDFRSIGMTEEQVEIVMTEVMKRMKTRASETSEATPPHLERDNSRGLAVFKVGLRDSDHSYLVGDHKPTSQDRCEMLEARNASLSQQVTDLKEASEQAKIRFEAALQEEHNKFLEMQRENANLKHLIAENTRKARDEESRLSLEIKTLKTELDQVATARDSDKKSGSDLLESRNASLSQQVAGLKQANKDAKAHYETSLQEANDRFEVDLARLKHLNAQMVTEAKQTAQRETHRDQQLRAKTQEVSDLEQQLASLYTAYQMLQKEYDKLQQVTREKQAQQEEADFSTAASLDEIQKKHAAAEAAKRTHQIQLTQQRLKYYEAASAKDK